MIIFIVCSLYKYVDKLLLTPEYDVFVSQISYEKHLEGKAMIHLHNSLKGNIFQE